MTSKENNVSYYLKKMLWRKLNSLFENKINGINIIILVEGKSC